MSYHLIVVEKNFVALKFQIKMSHDLFLNKILQMLMSYISYDFICFSSLTVNTVVEEYTYHIYNIK